MRLREILGNYHGFGADIEDSSSKRVYMQPGEIAQAVTRKILNDEEASWLSGYGFDYFITLTYRYGVTSDIVVRRDLHMLHRLVSQKLFGRQAFAKFPEENSIQFVPVIEKHSSDDLHIHMLVKEIALGNEYARASIGEIPGLILNAWSKIARNPVQLNVQRIDNAVDLLAVCKYCLKQQGSNRDNIVLDYIN